MLKDIFFTITLIYMGAYAPMILKHMPHACIVACMVIGMLTIYYYFTKTIKGE